LSGLLRIASTLACSTLFAVGALADVVTLRDGKTVEGRVVRETAAEVVVRIGSRERRIPAAEVASVASHSRKLDDALAIWERLSPQDLGAATALAQQCAAGGLDAEARLFALHVLSLSPEDQTCHELAGHEKRGDAWFVRNGAKRESFAKRYDRTLDWGDAWELETTHFTLRSNLTLRDAAACALELELGYRNFFAWFGGELPLYEIVEPLKANVYASSAEYPEINARSAYFDPGANTLHVNAQTGLDLYTLAHELTHQLLHGTATNTRAGTGAIPAWLDEGLAEYIANCREAAPGRAHYARGKLSEAHFARQRGADKPYGLSRILSMDSGDFSASSNADLKYSQAYTLVHFCLHGGDAAQTAGFYEFLRRAYAGKSSMSAFKDALGVKEREFEAAWLAYVARGG